MGAMFRWVKKLYESVVSALLGVKVCRVTTTPPTTAIDRTNLFNVGNGRVLLTDLTGTVTTTTTGTSGTVEIKLTHTPTTGALAETDMCLQVDIKGDTAETMYNITGATGVAMNATAITGINVPSFATNKQILQPGIVKLHLAVGTVVEGAIRWTVTYIPIDEGAVVTAA